MASLIFPRSGIFGSRTFVPVPVPVPVSSLPGLKSLDGVVTLSRGPLSLGSRDETSGAGGPGSAGAAAVWDAGGVTTGSGSGVGAAAGTWVGAMAAMTGGVAVGTGGSSEEISLGSASVNV